MSHKKQIRIGVLSACAEQFYLVTDIKYNAADMNAAIKITGHKCQYTNRNTRENAKHNSWKGNSTKIRMSLPKEVCKTNRPDWDKSWDQLGELVQSMKGLGWREGR